MEKIQYIDPTAKIGKNTEIGHFAVVGKNVIIGDSCLIGSNVVIHEGTKIGKDVRIDDNTVIGKSPMRAKRSIFKEEKNLESAFIGDACLIGAQVIVYQGCHIDHHVLIADSSAVRENVIVGEYTIVGRGVTIENFTKIGKKCKLETGSYITAYSEIEDYCFIAPMVTTTNDNYLGRTKERFEHFKGVHVELGGRIGANATILPGKVIGKDAVVGAGAVVTKDVPERRIVVGSPAKDFGPTPEAQLLENQDWD
jgi:UDP-2-acetamido-3-amino-2,3-dideoxy-glucuronate N-acetyltransferase